MALSTAIDPSAVARVTGVKTIFKNLNVGGVLFLPQRAIVVGQGSTASTYSTTKAQVFSAFEAGTTYGFGSPIHLAALQFFPTNGDGIGTIPLTIYPLEDDGSGVEATGNIAPVGPVTKAGAVRVVINNIQSNEIVLAITDTDTQISTKIIAAISAVLEQPVIASANVATVDVDSKWKGTSANDLFIEMTGATDTGVAFGLTQPVGGLVNPDVDDALNQIGDVWESMALNCLDIADTTTLDKYSTFGEGRWNPLVRKPMVVFTGNNEVNPITSITVSDARKTDRTNGQLVAPGSNDLPFVTAARQMARIVKLANTNPPHDYGSQAATGLTPGTDGEQWTYAQRDAAVKGGSSTTESKDGVVNISDVVTFYHPTGDPAPAYRFVVDIVKLQNIIFNIDLIFAVPEWDGAPLLPDADPTVNPAAKKPKDAVAAVAALLDNLGLNAIISDPATAKANTFAEIDSGNAKRLNLVTTVALSGNTNIKSIDLNFGFFTPALEAA